jgi:glutaredoxin-related protein
MAASKPAVRARARRLASVKPEERTTIRQHCYSQAHVAEEFDRLETRYKREGRGSAKELHRDHPTRDSLAAFLQETGGGTCGLLCALVDCVPASLPTSNEEVRL